MSGVKRERCVYAVVALVLSFGGVTAFGARVLKASPRGILVQVDSRDPQLDDKRPVCVEGPNKIAVCGNVLKRAGSRVVIGFATPLSFARGFTVGNEVQVSNSRAPASVSTPVTRKPAPSWWDRPWSFSAGAQAGLNYLYPVVNVELDLGSGMSLGAQPLFFYQRGTGSAVTGGGGFLTFSYYFGSKAFHGLGLELGAGAYALGIVLDDLQDNTLAWAGFAQLQYRAALGGGWFLGFNAGAQYILLRTYQVSVAFNGLVPMGTVVAGFHL